VLINLVACKLAKLVPQYNSVIHAASMTHATVAGVLNVPGCALAEGIIPGRLPPKFEGELPIAHPGSAPEHDVTGYSNSRCLQHACNLVAQRILIDASRSG
jgi:hypothetical protein